MAKIKVRPRPGALAGLLKQKGMTKMDAFEKTRVDRKTLSKIDRGEEVKLETLQQVANKLGVTEEYLRPPAAEMTDDGEVPKPGTILARKLDADGLVDLLQFTDRIDWHLCGDTKVRGEEARKALEDLETVAENFQKQHVPVYHDLNDTSLRIQLEHSKFEDDIAAVLERLSEHRFELLGAQYLFWECEEHDYEDKSGEHYLSSHTALLCVVPFGTQSRRQMVEKGDPPPLLAPTGTAVYVNGSKLLPLDEQ